MPVIIANDLKLEKSDYNPKDGVPIRHIAPRWTPLCN